MAGLVLLSPIMQGAATYSKGPRLETLHDDDTSCDKTNVPEQYVILLHPTSHYTALTVQQSFS